MSGDRGGQGIGTSLPIYLPENVLSQKAIHTTRAFLRSRHLTNNGLRNVNIVASAICWRQKKLLEFYYDQLKNHMWLAQFVCAPQFFKAPKGLCGHTVF
jgi:hypothetical protein